ncbi:MAG: hypothetical protein K2N41_03285, partial [Lachnospiraceae bacterium]|nr:hypothetical protein [Lachnospiraceae bacterium]
MMKTMWLKKKAGRMLGILMAAVITAATVPAAELDSRAAYQSDQIDYEALLDIVQDSGSYGSYLSSHAGAAYPDAQIIVSGGDFAEASDGFVRLEDYAELGNACALTLEEGSITYEVVVEQEGFYNMRLVYYPVEGKNNEIGRSVSVNGEIPYDEAQYFEFTRIWQNADEIVRDARDNDVRPKQEEAPSWISVYCKDSEGFYQDAMYFYMEKGVNTITFDSTQEPMIIGQLILEQEERPISYAEYQSANARAGYTQVSAEPIKIQAEDASYKSNSTLYPITDRSSPLTEPQNAAKTRLNTVGGSNWSLNGQWITWDVEVPEDGLYEIAVKYRQNKNQGVTVVRALYLDGEIPFAEASQLQFYYNNSWKITALGNGEESYQFYLSKGIHTLTLMVGLDEELAEILRMTDECVTQLNAAYRQLLMVIGTSPDTMRDYQLELKVPEALSILEEQYALVRVLEEKIKDYSRGSKGSQTATIQNLANQLRLMTENPKRIAKQWSAFKENIVALSSWELSMKEQPLEIDYLLVEEPGEKLPKVNAGFFSSLIFEIKKFAASFVEDYDSIGNVYGGETLEVWILADSTAITSQSGGGRDQAIVIKDLVDNYFVPQTGIAVNVKLVNKDVLLSATLAGEGPDVALNVAGKEPVNYALRNAAVDLTQFDDYEEVASWFYHDALTQFTYNGGVYALPQTM